MTQQEAILQALDIIVEDKIWPDRKPSQILNILMYVNSKGWLYTTSVQNKVRTIICGYRIPEVSDDTMVKLPVEEIGTILYIPFVLSLNKEDNIYKIIREALGIFLKENQDLTEMVIEDKNNKIKRYKLGESYGEESATTVASTSNIPN